MNDLNVQKGAGPANRQLDFRQADLEFVGDDDESVNGLAFSDRLFQKQYGEWNYIDESIKAQIFEAGLK